jgi:hypothetical protein
LGNVVNRLIGEFEDQLAGPDLGEVKHVIDQAKEVLALGLQPLKHAKDLF